MSRITIKLAAEQSSKWQFGAGHSDILFREINSNLAPHGDGWLANFAFGSYNRYALAKVKFVLKDFNFQFNYSNKAKKDSKTGKWTVADVLEHMQASRGTKLLWFVEKRAIGTPSMLSSTAEYIKSKHVNSRTRISYTYYVKPHEYLMFKEKADIGRSLETIAKECNKNTFYPRIHLGFTQRPHYIAVEENQYYSVRISYCMEIYPTFVMCDRKVDVYE